MAEFVKESLHLAVRHQRGFVARGRREVAHQGGVRNLVSHRGALARDHSKAGGVSVLVGPWKEVEVETPDPLVAIEHFESADIRVPHGGIFKFDIPYVEKRLCDLEESCQNVVQRKVFFYHIVVDLVLLLQQNVFKIGRLPVIDAVSVPAGMRVAYGKQL